MALSIVMPLLPFTMALIRFKGRPCDCLHQRVHIGAADGPWYSTVGVVGDVKQASLAASQPDAVYITTTQSPFVDSALSLMVRARDDAAVLTLAIRNAIWSADKDQPIVQVATMDTCLRCRLPNGVSR